MIKNYLQIVVLMTCVFVSFPAGATDYDLTAYLRKVESNNLQIRLARNGIESSNTDAAMARSALFPAVTVQGGYSHNLTDTMESTPVGSNLNSAQNGIAPLVYKDIDTNFDNEFTVAFSVNQKIFDPSSAAAYQRAMKGRAVMSAQYEAVLQNVMTSAKKIYAQAQLTMEVAAIAAESEVNAYALYESAKRRAAVGTATQLEVLAAESTWKSCIPDTSEAKQNAELVMDALKDLAGIPLNEEVRLTEKRLSLPTIPEERPIGEILASRPDYTALFAAKEIADISKKAALASYIPTVNASITYATGLFTGYASKWDETDYTAAQAGVMVTLRLFSGGYRIALSESASLAQDKAAINLEQKSRDIEREIRRLLFILDEAYDRIASRQAAVAVSKRAMELSQASFEAGSVSQQSVNDALERYRKAELGFHHAVFTYLSAYYDLELAAGMY